MIINHKEYSGKISELENTISQLQETISSLSSAVASKADASAISQLQTSIDSKVGAWKLAGSATNKNSITLPSNFNELLIVVSIDVNNGSELATKPICTGVIPKQALSSTSKYYNLTHSGACMINANLTSLYLYAWYSANNDLMGNYSITRVYYR